MYIGRKPQVGNFQVCDAISVVNGQAAYTMQVDSVNVSPETANHCLVSLNGVLQKSSGTSPSFTISGSTITFASNLVTGDVINFIHILGSVLDLGVPSDSTVTNAKTNFVSTSSAAGLQIKGDGTTDGTLQLNCSQNSHGIKLKSPSHGSAQSYTLTFPTTAPSSGKALVTDGSGNLSFSSAGSFTKLASTTISSGVAAVSFNSTYINSSYDNYRVIAYGLSTSADNQDIALRMSVDNGSNFATHVGCFNYTHINASSSNSTGAAGSRASIPLGSDEEGDASGGTNFIIDLMNLNSTTQYKFANGLGTVNNQTNSDYYGYRVHGYIASNTAVNFIKVFTEAGGNLDAGTITLYGYEK
nr:hypothetical protein [uncultured Mediterranean phage uvMED]